MNDIILTTIHSLLLKIRKLTEIETQLENPLQSNISQYNKVRDEFREALPHCAENFNSTMFTNQIESLEATIDDLTSLAKTLNSTLEPKYKMKDEVFSFLVDNHTLDDLQYIDRINHYDFTMLFSKSKSWQEKKRVSYSDPLPCKTSKHNEVFYSKKEVTKWMERNGF